MWSFAKACIYGCMDWASRFGGMEWWNGTVEWNSGMVEYWNGGVTTPIGSVFGRSLPTESIQRKGQHSSLSMHRVQLELKTSSKRFRKDMG